MSEPVTSLERHGFKPKLPEVFDASMLSDYVNCPAKFYLRHVLGLELKGFGAPALDWGSLWHTAMYELHKEWEVGHAIGAVSSQWSPILTEQDPKGRTLDRMVMILQKYYGQYSKLDQHDYHTIRREEYFEIHCDADSKCPFGGCGLSWSGRIDRVVRNRADRVLVWDYKTTSWMRSSFYDELEHGFQIPGYVWAASHLLQNRILGAMIDVLHTLKSQENLYRREFRFHPRMMIEWRDNVKRWIERIHHDFDRYSHDPEAWPQNKHECDRFSGCQFKPVHYTPEFGDDTRLRIMREEYVENRWHPAQTLEEAVEA